MFKSRIARAGAVVLLAFALMGAGAGIALAVTAASYHHVYVEYQTKFGPLRFGASCPHGPVMSNGGLTATYGEGKTRNRCIRKR